MKRLVLCFSKPYRWAATYGTLLALCFAVALLDAFVIPRALPQGSNGNTKRAQVAPQTKWTTPTTQIVTATTYEDENIRIQVETLREYDTTFYVADITISDASLLRTAFANETYGRNMKQITSAIAETKNAIFAINGDYYGFRDSGFVLRNGTLYRDLSNDVDALVIDTNGDFSIVNENELSLETLEPWQVLSFGPALVVDGEVAVSAESEVSGRSMNSNPRTAIGQVSTLHYIVIVSDGRTRTDAGFSLEQLAIEFWERGCKVAYNLDGGGSSCMVLNGRVINTPVDGKRNGERAVSDIVYIGYP